MSNLAIIPARGGSKGIPGKNIKPILGKPLLAYSIEQAQACAAIERIVVSTDDPIIAEVARQYGAEVVERPADLSGDTASSESALVHVLETLATQEQYEPEAVFFLQATSPLRHPDDLSRAYATFQAQQADSLLSVSPFHGFLWRIGADGPQAFNYDHLNRPRRQDAPDDVMENGSFYLFKPWVLRQFNNRLGGKIAVHRMSVLDGFQVDEPDDLILIDHLLRLRQAQP
jgi:N-acylneuraminate cytidylyltransferase